MAIIGLSGEEQNDILRMLSAILWIGNVSYNERDDGNAEIADAGTVDFVAYLLEAPSELVSKVLTTKVVETQRGGRRGSVGAHQETASQYRTHHQHYAGTPYFCT